MDMPPVTRVLRTIGQALAAGLVLIATGKVTDTDWALYLGVIVAVLGLGAATAYRPTGPRS